jgi:DNA replication protein DnaC
LNWPAARDLARVLVTSFSDGDRQWRKEQRRFIKLAAAGSSIVFRLGSHELGLLHTNRLLAPEIGAVAAAPFLLTLEHLSTPVVCTDPAVADALEGEWMRYVASEPEELEEALSRQHSAGRERVDLRSAASSIENAAQTFRSLEPVPNPRYFCAKCQDEGFVEVKTPAGGRGVQLCECKRERMAARRSRIVAKPIPKNWRNFGFDRLSPELPSAVMAHLRRWVSYYLDALSSEGEPPSRGLWIVGRSGTIKTGAAAAAAQEIGWRLHEVDRDRWMSEWRHSWLGWWPLNKLLRELRATQAEDAEVSERQLHLALASVQLLVLDDLVAPRITPFASEALYGILDARYEEGLPTIITTNLIDEDELETRIGAEDAERGESIVRRIRERCVRIEFPERDREYADLPQDVDETRLAPRRDAWDDFDERDTGYGRRPAA